MKSCEKKSVRLATIDLKKQMEKRTNSPIAIAIAMTMQINDAVHRIDVEKLLFLLSKHGEKESANFM